MIALALRLFHLGHESLGLDEFYTALQARLPFYQMIKTLESYGTNPPLHNIIIYAWTRVFGESEASLRFTSVLFSVACVGMTWRLARRFWGLKAAMIASLLVCLSDYQIFYAQECRVYALFGLLALLSIDLFWTLIHKPAWHPLISYFLIGILLLYSHPYAVFILMVQNVYLIALWILQKPTPPLQWKQWIPLQCCLFVCFIPWIRVISNKADYIHSILIDDPRPPIQDLPGALKTFSGSNIETNNIYFGLLFLALSLLGIFCVFRFRRLQSSVQFRFLRSLNRFLNPDEARKMFFLGFLIVGIIVVPFTLSYMTAPLFAHRYLIPAAFAYYLMVTRGVLFFHNKKIKIALVCLLVSTGIYSLAGYYTLPHKLQWRPCIRHIESTAQAGDLVLFYPSYWIQLSHPYYHKRDDLVIKGVHQQATPDMIEQTIPDWIRGYQRIYLIEVHDSDSENMIKKHFAPSYESTGSERYYCIEVHQYQALKKSTDEKN